jgi:quercetin dioxygenase-like cupin family protein
MLLGASVLGAAIAMAASVVVTDTTNVRLRVIQSAFEQGFDSGWHSHPGPVIVQVQEGQFKIYQGGCEPKVVHEGETFLEVPLVPVRAIAKGPIRWTTSQILPAAEPPQTPAATPCR